MLGKKLKIEEETVAKQQVPDVFKGMLGPITNPAGWTKSLEGLPSFTINEINNFFKNSGKSVLKNVTVVKKSFKRGEQLIEENFVDLFNIYCYNEDELFSVKALCAASLRRPIDGYRSQLEKTHHLLNLHIVSVKQDKVDYALIRMQS